MGCQKFARGPWPALDDYCKPASNLRRSQLLLAELHDGHNAHGSRGAHGLHRERPPSGHQGLSRAAQHKQHKAAEHVYDELEMSAIWRKKFLYYYPLEVPQHICSLSLKNLIQEREHICFR